MTKPYNYDWTVIDNFFNITVKKTHLKSDFISVLAKQHKRLLTRGWNLAANIFESSHFCQPLFEGNFSITPEWVTNPKLL